MRQRRLRLMVLFAVAIGCACTVALGLGLPLNQSKEELQLKYELNAVAHGDSVLITLTISDLGKLKPLSAVVLDVPNKGGKGEAEVFYN